MSYDVYDISGDTYTVIHKKLQPIIKPIWTSIFPEGTIADNTSYTLLKIDKKLAIDMCTMLPYLNGDNAAKYCGIVLRTSVSHSSNEPGIDDILGSVYSRYYGAYAAATTSLGKKYLHVAIGKQKKTIAFGISDDPNRIVLNVLVSKLKANEFVGIQFRCMDPHTYISGGDFTEDEDYAGYNYRWDTYTKDFDTTATTQRMYGCGLYTSASILTIVPTIDPWRNVPIPDTYMSVCGPMDMAGLDGKISINGRTFITGHVNSYATAPASPMIMGSIADGGICTFIEI